MSHLPVRIRAATRAFSAGTTLCVLAILCAAPFRPGTPGQWRARSAAAQPAPASTPPLSPARLFGDPRPCEAGIRVDAVPEAVVVGARITVAATAHVACPNAFDGASVVVLAGGTTGSSHPKFRAAVGAWTDALDATGAALAVVDAAAPSGQVRWAATAADRRAALDGLRARPDNAAVTGTAWAAALRSAAAALAALPPTRRPLLVVVDGRRPAGDSAASLGDLEAVAFAVRDAAGVTAVVDVSFDGWLADGVRRMDGAGIVGLDATVDRTAAIVEDGTRQLVDGLRGVVEPALFQLAFSEHHLALVSGSVWPPAVRDDPGPQWVLASDNGRVSLSGRAALDAEHVGVAALEFALDALRDGVPIASVADVRFVCVHPPGGSAADCQPPAQPTASRTPLPTATPPPAATATGATQSLATATASPTATREPAPPPAATPSPPRPAGRIWLPLGLRRHAGGG